MPILTFLNSPLGVLLVGSGIGSAFIRFVWEPYKVREARRAVQDKFRKEARYRFHMMKDKDRMGRQSYITGDSPSSAWVIGLNPEYRMWSIMGLVSEGWDHKVFTESLPLLEQLFACDDSKSADRIIATLAQKL
jgi:hypothetical protein